MREHDWSSTSDPELESEASCLLSPPLDFSWAAETAVVARLFASWVACWAGLRLPRILSTPPLLSRAAPCERGTRDSEGGGPGILELMIGACSAAMDDVVWMLSTGHTAESWKPGARLVI
jgi:hypothetical protein